MAEKNAELLFALLRTEVCGKSIDKDYIEKTLFASEGSDALAELCRFANDHDMMHIVASALSGMGLISEERELDKKILKKQFSAVYRYRGFEYELNAVQNLFTDAKIRHIPLKGSVLRRYYPAPWMRTSCDIDIYVDESDLQQAVSLLSEKLSYKLVEKGSHDYAFVAPSGLHVELHFDLIEDSIFKDVANMLKDIWKHAVARDGSYTYELSDEMFYFYHISHMAKHFVRGGCGIKPFLDIWVLKNRVEHDEEARLEKLREGGMLAFAKGAEALSARWFDEAPATEQLETMESIILSGGTYGDIDNYVRIRNARSGGRLKYILSRIFIPYSEMKLYYPAVEKHKILVPFYALKRWFRLLFTSRSKRARVELSSVNSMSEEDVARISETLSALGLVK